MEWLVGRVERMEAKVEKQGSCLVTVKTKLAVLEQSFAALKEGRHSNRLVLITLITMVGNIVVTILAAVLK